MNSQPKQRWLAAASVAVFVILLALLTRGLLTPVPASAVQITGGDDSSFWISKCVHVGAYGFMAWIAARLPIGRRWRIGLVILLLLHGGLTEYLQQFVGRGASLRDVILDCIGVALGTWIGWRLRFGRGNSG